MKKALILLFVLAAGCAGRTVYFDTAPVKAHPGGPWAVGTWEGSVPGGEWPVACEKDEEDAQPFKSTATRVLSETVQLLRFLVSKSRRSHCQFKPSCGEYSLQAISEYGPLWGFLMTGDRLMRCNRDARKSGLYRQKRIGPTCYLLDEPREHFLPVSYEPRYIVFSEDLGF